MLKDPGHSYSPRSVVIAAIVAVLVLIAIIWPLSMIGKGSRASAGADEAEVRIQPVARVEMRQAPAAVPGQPRSGETVYATVCKACHDMGLAGAPKTGDKAAWAPRIAQGLTALLSSVRNGKGAMPPKGGGADLSDDELKAAVDYLVAKSK